MSKNLTNLNERFLELDALPKGLSAEDAQRRGLRFESLILDLFEIHGMLRRRSYHTSDGSAEQIDGALRIDGRLALVEVKWVKSQLAASELFAFSGKVDGKFTGTIGVFISRNELSVNFLNALRTGRRQAVLVIHGQDIDEIFKDNFPLEEYLESSLEVTSIDNTSHYPVSEFLSRRASLAATTVQNSAKGISPDIEEALQDGEFGYFAHEVARDISDLEVDDVFNEIITQFKNQAKQGKLDQNYAGNLVLLAKELKPRLSNKRLEADWTLFNSFSKGFINSPLRPFNEIFSDRLKLLSTKERETFSERLLRQWDGIVGDYNKENELAEITKPLWGYLEKSVKSKLLTIFVSFVVSSRVPRYPQVRFADECIRNANNEDLSAAVCELLHKNVESWMSDENLEEFTEIDRSRLVSWQVREYSKIKEFVDMDIADVINGYINEMLEKHKENQSDPSDHDLGQRP